VAVISTVAAVIGIAQIGLTAIVVSHEKRSFVGVDIAIIVWTVLLFIPVIGIYRLERRD
jgi:hypothetical protein